MAKPTFTQQSSLRTRRTNTASPIAQAQPAQRGNLGTLLLQSLAIMGQSRPIGRDTDNIMGGHMATRPGAMWLEVAQNSHD
ncbi:hypothetical protein PAPYR_10591 [Paratrimastix pyriformis]|uniref:Uncharacterized protein n=1 Tax=Paratrimastix pyriformis TaxID=342808 RepID=A0ABQ8U5L7_9EUKA|nr:hypothetical protein PAPYR_10591 [Paratrimastix pyriformis]